MFENAIDLTSYERVRTHLEITKDSIENRRLILDWISTVSCRVQDFLQRDLLIQERVQYDDVLPGQLTFPVDAYPILAIGSVESDAQGLFDSPIDLQDYYPSANADAIVLNYVPSAGPRAIRHTYTGGLTYHATQSIYVLTAVTALVVGNYVEGQSSMAIGRIKNISGFNVTVEVLLGRFQVSELLKSYTNDTLQGEITLFTGVSIASVTRRCLAESHPLIVKAVEMEIRYMKQHKLDFENVSSGKEGTTRRLSSKLSTPVYELQPEVEALIYRYKRVTV